MNKFAALLHTRWLPDGTNTTGIYGFWAEDNSHYHFDVPEQLRNDLVDLQNVLSDRYNEAYDTKCKAIALKRQFEAFFTN